VTQRLLVGVTFVATLGCGLIGGVFFAFSTFVMGALSRLPAPQGIAAMQSINVVVLNPRFLTPFVGTALLSAFLVVGGLFLRPGNAFLWIAGLLYLAGTFLVTMVCNVPRNDALAVVDPLSAEAARLWSAYVPGWTLWNHVRTAAALAASALLTLALRAGIR